MRKWEIKHWNQLVQKTLLSFTISKTEKLDGDNCLKEKSERATSFLKTGIIIASMYQYTDGTEIMEGQLDDTGEEIFQKLFP